MSTKSCLTPTILMSGVSMEYVDDFIADDSIDMCTWFAANIQSI